MSEPLSKEVISLIIFFGVLLIVMIVLIISKRNFLMTKLDNLFSKIHKNTKQEADNNTDKKIEKDLNRGVKEGEVEE